MNYLWYHLTRDPKFWIKIIVIPAVLILNLFDFLTYVFKPPGLSNLWIFRISAAISILGVIVYGVYLFVMPQKNKKISEEQAIFEEKRLQELKKTIKQNPHFQTFCFECKHFNLEIKTCSLDIKNLKAKSVRLGEKYKYCLYWDSMNE
jgi:hypothetical protein